jgi:hypothetical protein
MQNCRVRQTDAHTDVVNLLYNYNSVYVCPSVRQRFRVLIDVAEPARTVRQFRILMDRRNRAGQIVRPGRRNSQGEETDRSFGLADGILKVKRRNAWGILKTGFGPSVRLSCRAGQAGQGPNKEYKIRKNKTYKTS